MGPGNLVYDEDQTDADCETHADLYSKQKHPKECGHPDSKVEPGDVKELLRLVDVN